MGNAKSMNSKQLKERLEADPSNENLALAKAWLRKRKQAGPASMEISKLLLGIRKDDLDFQAWFSDWIADKNWELLYWSTQEFVDLNTHDWLVNFANSHDDNSQTGTLWLRLLQKYRSEEVIDGASRWFLKHAKSDAVSKWVAENLLELAQNPNVIQVARSLEIDNTDTFFVANLLRAYPDDNIAFKAARMLDSDEDDLVLSRYLAQALLEHAPEKYWSTVENWLRRNWKDSRLELAFDGIISIVPDKSIPLLLEWIGNSHYARFGELYGREFSEALSQPLLDLTWNWLKDRQKERHFLGILQVLLSTNNRLNIPLDAVKIAHEWLTKNVQDVFYFPSFLLHLLCIEVNEERIALAKEWINCHTDKQKAMMYLVLLKALGSPDIQKEVRAWLSEHPNPEIYAELLRFNHEAETVESARRCFNRLGSKNYWWRKLLYALITVGEPEAVKTGKKFLRQRTLEQRWGPSATEMKNEILSCLMVSTPHDEEVLEFARNKFQ